jgi:Cu/Ag efflux pump CusA
MTGNLSEKDTTVVLTAPLSDLHTLLLHLRPNLLALRAMSFSISAGVGFIALFGVAVLNGVVLLS